MLYEVITAEIKESPEKTTKEITITVPTEDGGTEESIMSFNAIPEFNENELETILFVGHDITEAKRIELEIQDKNRKIEDSINYARRITSYNVCYTKLLRSVCQFPIQPQ